MTPPKKARWPTGPEFVLVLLRQRDHANANRARVYDNLITAAEETTP